MTALSCEPPVGAFARYVDTKATRERCGERLPALLGASTEINGCCYEGHQKKTGGI